METSILTLQKQLNDPSLSLSERAALRCELARELEEAGNYESARHALIELWPEDERHPNLSGLNESTSAEVLLRAGTIRGWLSSANPTTAGQEEAKDLLTKALDRYEKLNDRTRICETLTNLAFCYWREGSLSEARITFKEALQKLGEPAGQEGREQKANTLMSAAIVELSATKLHTALTLMDEAEPLVAQSERHILRGRFHANRGIILKNLSAGDENQEHYADRAFKDFTAALFHFEQSHHTRFRANTENNLGFLFFTLHRYAEAEDHLERARSLFTRLKDATNVAQVDETRARVLLAQRRNADAEKLIQTAVRTLEKGDQYAHLAEALITQGTARARIKRTHAAHDSYTKAMAAAERAGALEHAGLAALTMLEEIFDTLAYSEAHECYRKAADALSTSQSKQILTRLLAAANHLITGSASSAGTKPSGQTKVPEIFIHTSHQMSKILDHARQIASSSYPVLITGETGTGKDLLARLIHQWSGRTGPLVAINCAAMPKDLIESQLFGHRKGAFTNAVADQPGAARHSAGGTLFLDEIKDIGIDNQAKLLRLIENNEIQTVGAPAPETVDTRIIAATNQNLDELVRQGLFRQDLRYRFGVTEIYIPPLRERRQDITALARHFIKQANLLHRKQVIFTDDAMELIRRLPLPGNTRELKALIERAVLLAQGPASTIDAARFASLTHLTTPKPEQYLQLPDDWENFNFKAATIEAENALIRRALEETDGAVTEAARLLGMPHQTLTQRLETRNKGAAVARKDVVKRQKAIMRPPIKDNEKSRHAHHRS